MTEPVELATLQWGRANDRRLLIIHGLASNAGGWWRTGPDLADLGFLVIAVDLRGHGNSPHVDDYSVAAYADDLLALGGTWDVVLGHSLGGAAAVRALSKRAGWTRRLILEDPMLVILDPEMALQYVLEGFSEVVDLDDMAARNPTWHPEDVRIKAEAQIQAGVEVIEKSITHNEDWNLVSEVAALSVPTLLLGADPERGPLVPPALGASLAEMNPLIEFEVIPGGSHSMHRDEYDGFFEVVRRFVT